MNASAVRTPSNRGDFPLYGVLVHPAPSEKKQYEMVYLSYANLMESQREWVVAELEMMFKQYGKFIQKGSLEIESQLFDKARTPEEYMTLARRLLRHMLDVARQRQLKPAPVPQRAEMRPAVREDTGRNPFRVVAPPVSTHISLPQPQLPPAHSATTTGTTATIATATTGTTATDHSTVLSSRNEVLPTPSADGMEGIQTLSEVVPPVQPSPPPVPPSGDMLYEAVRLPAPNKRTFASISTSNHKTSCDSNGDSRRNSRDDRGDARDDRDGSRADSTEIITRLLHDMGGDARAQPQESVVMEGDLSQETYEASYKFFVPKNSVIKQITIHLKKVR